MYIYIYIYIYIFCFLKKLVAISPKYMAISCWIGMGMDGDLLPDGNWDAQQSPSSE